MHVKISAVLLLALVGSFCSTGKTAAPDRRLVADGLPDRVAANDDSSNPIDHLGADRPSSDKRPVADRPPPPKSITIVFAADIAEQDRTAHARANAALIAQHSPPVSAILLGGDNARWGGVLSLTSLLNYYNTYYKPASEANWGQFDAIVFPQTGNHEYSWAIGESGAQGYFDYFSTRMAAIKAMPSYHGFVDVVGKGYYSFDLNGWHIVSINSNLDLAAGGGQETWFKADLAAHATMPIIAVWHEPRYTCGTGDESHVDAPEMQPFWADLYDAGGDLVFNGHNHLYQRYKPLNKDDPQAAVDTAKGVTQIIAGSYGVSTYSVCDPADARVEKQIGDDGSIGVFFLTLSSDGSYSFQYVLEGGTLFDSGSGISHHHI